MISPHRRERNQSTSRESAGGAEADNEQVQRFRVAKQSQKGDIVAFRQLQLDFHSVVPLLRAWCIGRGTRMVRCGSHGGCGPNSM